MTPRQIELARHALGLSESCLRSRRNHFLAWRGTEELYEWMRMVGDGIAERPVAALPADLAMFRLTRAGAERALKPGDVLDPEDWA